MLFRISNIPVVDIGRMLFQVPVFRKTAFVENTKIMLRRAGGLLNEAGTEGTGRSAGAFCERYPEAPGV
jgi:hypothetical protein